MKRGPKPNPNRKTKSHSIWLNMKQRCLNPNHTAYKYYGAKGITIYEPWLLFDNFYNDMGECPKDLTLERIDSNKGYSPLNCRWATRLEQMQNISSNINVTHNGVTKNLTQWSKALNIAYGTLRHRYKNNWRGEKLFSLSKRPA